MLRFNIGNFVVFKDPIANRIVIASKDRCAREGEERWILNTLNPNEAKDFLEKFSELIG